MASWARLPASCGACRCSPLRARSRSGRPRIPLAVRGEGVADVADGGDELGDVVEGRVDGGETDVGDGVEGAEALHDERADGLRGDFVAPTLLDFGDDAIDEEVITAIAKQQPLYAVFKDKSFASDSVAINNEQLFKTYSPLTEVKVV